MDRFAVLFGRYRLLLACLVSAATGICLFGMSRVTFDDDPMRLLKSDKIELKWLEDDFAHLEHTTLIVVQGEDLLTREAVNGIRKIVAGAAEVEGVANVYSMLSARDGRRVGRYLLPLFPSSGASDERFDRARRRAASHPLLVGHFVSEDWKTGLVIVELDPRLRGIPDFKGVLGPLRAMLAQCTEGSGLRTRITGSAALQVEIVESMRRDIFWLSLLGIGLVNVIAILMFRRIAAAFLVAAGPVVGMIWTVGTLGLIGQPLNMLTNVVPLLVLVIGFTDAMHLVLHMRRALASGRSGMEAARSSIRHLGLACALTSLSTAVGFGSLSVASLNAIRTFGWCCALGSGMSFLAVITVVPLLASTRLSQYLVAVKPHGEGSALAGFGDWVLCRLLRYPRLVLACGAVLTVALALVATQLEPDHTIAHEIPNSSEAYRALEHVDRTFGGMMLAYAIVEWPPRQGLGSQELYDVLEEVHQVFEDHPVPSNPLSMLNLVKSISEEGQSLSQRARQLRDLPGDALRGFVNLDRRRSVVSAHVPDVGARILRPAFAEVQRRFDLIARRHPGYGIELAGGTSAVFRSVHLMIEDLWKSLATAAGAMLLMILVGLRSLRYALVSVIPNVFPLLVAGAFIVLSGRYLEMSSVIVFSISLGIAVDDTIHFLVRFDREIQAGADARSAVQRTFKVVGTALVMTTVALVAGHGVVMLSSFPAIRVFGLITAITIASALVADLLFLPATLICLKWPPPEQAEAESTERDR